MTAYIMNPKATAKLAAATKALKALGINPYELSRLLMASEMLSRLNGDEDEDDVLTDDEVCDSFFDYHTEALSDEIDAAFSLLSPI